MGQPFNLEQHLIDIPDDVWKELRQKEVPTGIGWTKETGLFVLQTAGQGPCLLWQQCEGTLMTAVQHDGKIYIFNGDELPQVSPNSTMFHYKADMVVHVRSGEVLKNRRGNTS